MRDLRRLLRYLLPHTGTFAIATLAMIVVAVLEIATSALIVPIFNQVLPSGKAHTAATPFALQRLIPPSGLAAWRMIALLMVVFTIVKGIAEYFSTYLMAYIGQSSVLRLRQELYRHLLSQSAAFFERHRTNYLVSLLIAPPVFGLTMWFGTSLRKLARESFEGNKRLTDTAQEALANHSIVKAYRAEAREQNRFTAVAQRVLRANLRSASISGMSPPIIELISVLFIAGLLFFAEREIRLHRMDQAQFILFLILLFRSYDPMRKLSRLQNSMSQALAAARHVWEVMDEAAEVPERPNAVELPPLQREIQFVDVHFGYGDESRAVLRGINLTVPAGKLVALVGQSGGGKSTLTKLLPRFHDPTSGAVLWDGIDLRDARVSSLRRQLALVTQETVLFNDTVRYNISYGRPDATDAQLDDAAKTALAHDFIVELPNGYDTIIGERGIFLSGGQRQRLAIARAVLLDAPMLILDEATSSLDAESERLVQRAIGNLILDRTTMVIAHSLSTVRRADLIVVIERGQIIEQGTH